MAPLLSPLTIRGVFGQCAEGSGTAGQAQGDRNEPTAIPFYWTVSSMAECLRN